MARKNKGIRTERTNERNNEIRSKFNKMDAKVFTLDHRLKKVANEYFLSPDTVYAIVKKIGRYKDG